MKIYCRKCKERQEAVDLVQIETTTGRPRIEGKCAVCSSGVSTFGWLDIPEVSITVVPKPTPLPPLQAVGPPVRLGTLREGTRFEAGGMFFSLDKIDMAAVFTHKLNPDGTDAYIPITMGVQSWVRRVK